MKSFFNVMMLGVLLLMSSCGSTKKLTYLQTEKGKIGTSAPIVHPYSIKVQDDDLLNITITSKDAELLLPFKNSMSLGGSQASGGYLVDNEGFIQLPLLGRMQVRGLSCKNVSLQIENALIAANYIKEPMVSTHIGNFKITLLGEVGSPGQQLIKGDRITILEAIGLAGDLSPVGKRKNVKILREQDGKQTIHEIDLTQADILNSPYYYLCQNDVIYVEPNKSIVVKSSPWTTYLSVGVSALSLLMSIVTLVTVSK